MNNTKPTCPHCNLSDEVVKYGKFEGIQRHWCKRCKRKFTGIDNLPKMKTPKPVITSALSCYFGGMPLDSIQRHLRQQYDLHFSESAIYYWVIRFAKEAVKQAKDFRPIVGSTWIADETMLSVGGKKIWFWDIIDLKSRYLLASHISTTRTTEDAATLMYKAAMKANKVPRRVITDKLAAYLDGIELVFGADAKHIQHKPFEVDNLSNIIERFHGTLKDRTKVVRGFKNMDTAKLLTDAWLIHYNFFKDHESLGNLSPAQKMGVKLPFKDWVDILENTKQDMLLGKPPDKPLVATRMPIVQAYAKTTGFKPKPIPSRPKPKQRTKQSKRSTSTHRTVTTTRG